jgi:hypothetical protein
MTQAKYFYCIINSNEEKNFGPFGIGGHGDEVFTIPYKDISAVVSNISLKELIPDEKNALTHMDVIQRVMKEQTVLPLKFGTIFKDIQGIEYCLTKIYTQAKLELLDMENKIEVGVRVSWSPESAVEFVKNNNEKIKVMKKKIQDAAKGKAYLLNAKMEQMINDDINKRSELFSREIYSHLKKFSIKSIESRLVGYIILNAAFLILRDSIDDFKEQVDLIKPQWEEKGLEISFTGPWPPYNFTHIKYE